MLKAMNSITESFREGYRQNFIQPLVEFNNNLQDFLNQTEVQNSIIDLFDEIKDLSIENPLPVQLVSFRETMLGDLYSNIEVREIPIQYKALFEQYLRYVKKESSLFSCSDKIPQVLVEYSYDDDKDKIFQTFGINPMSRKYHSKQLSKTMYLDFDLIENQLGLDKDIVEKRNEELANWEEFSKYLGSLKPGEVPKKPTWMSDAQWAEIKAMAMKEAWEDQEAFNREMVKELPPEAGEVVWEQIKRNYLASKSKTKNSDSQSATSDEKVD